MGFTHTGFIAPFCTQQTALQLDPLPTVGDSNIPNSLQLVTLPPWVDHEAAIATSVVCSIAVDEFLLRELDRFVGFDLVQAFYRRHRRERPATPTIPLIFNRSNSTFGPPINRLRQLLVTSDDISPAQPHLGLTWTGLMSWLRDIHHSSIHTNRQMGEWCSVVRQGTIAMYDYGSEDENNQHYGQPTPPVYNMASIPNDLPLFFSYGGQDLLSDVKDVKTLLATLKGHHANKLVVQYREDYAHADFVFGVNAKQVVYDPLMAFFKLH